MIPGGAIHRASSWIHVRVTYVSVHCTVYHLVSEAAHAYWAMYSTTSGADDMRFNFEAATLAVQTRR